MTHIIHCRALVSEACYDGSPTARQFFGQDLHQREDGTYQAPHAVLPDEGTIICDACYVELMPYTASGRALTHELPAAIAAYRAAHPKP